ncbi:MAG: hypothetical protein WBL05_03925 [Brooklawnia sp.]
MAKLRWSARASTVVDDGSRRSSAQTGASTRSTRATCSGAMEASISPKLSALRPSSGTNTRTTLLRSTGPPGRAWKPSPRPVSTISRPVSSRASTTLLLNTRRMCTVVILP